MKLCRWGAVDRENVARLLLNRGANVNILSRVSLHNHDIKGNDIR